MTAPSEAEIRAFMEAYEADNWRMGRKMIGELATETEGAFDDLIDGDHVTDDDYSVFGVAHHAEIEALLPEIDAALRPLMIEAQVRAAVRFFEHYPDAPIRRKAVPA